VGSRRKRKSTLDTTRAGRQPAGSRLGEVEDDNDAEDEGEDDEEDVDEDEEAEEDGEIERANKSSTRRRRVYSSS